MLRPRLAPRAQAAPAAPPPRGSSSSSATSSSGTSAPSARRRRRAADSPAAQAPSSSASASPQAAAPTRAGAGAGTGSARPPPSPHSAPPRPGRRVLLQRAEYRRNVGVCLVNGAGLVFAARRTDCSQGSWQMPQGGIDHLENPLAAAARELREETAITSARVVAISSAWTAYEHPTVVPLEDDAAATPASSSSPAAAAAAWGAALPGPPQPQPQPSTTAAAAANNILPTHVQYRGQTQKWVLMRFYGSDDEIALGDPAHPGTAFSAYAWLPLGDLVAGAVPFKRAVYEGVAAEFGPIIDAWRGEPDAPWWGGVRRC